MVAHTATPLGRMFLELIEPAVHRVEPAADSGQVRFITSSEFLDLDCRLEWLVDRVLVARQPAIIGGPKKAMKTSMLIDLAVSLATGGHFLDWFRVPVRRRVGLMSGESGQATLRETFLRICTTKEISDPRSVPIHWAFAVPRLTHAEDTEALSEYITGNNLEVVIIDPLYLALLAGGPEVNVSNLFQVGPLLSHVSSVCVDAGATPILVHHTVKRPANPFEPLDLEDLAFAGFQEFARQWMLISRREKYEPGSGRHRLWLDVGGSVGFSGCWAVDINEGVLQTDFTGRTWNVTVRSAADERSIVAQQRDAAKEQEARQKEVRDWDRVRQWLERHPNGDTMSAIRDATGLSGGRTRRALEYAQEHGLVEECQVEKGSGRSGATRLYGGWRLFVHRDLAEAPLGVEPEPPSGTEAGSAEAGDLEDGDGD